MADFCLDCMIQDYDVFFGEMEELTWQTKNGIPVPLSTMSDAHIQNCLKMLKRKKEDIDFWIVSFEDELKDRKDRNK